MDNDFDIGEGKDDVVYTTHIAPILEHYPLINNLKKSFQRKGKLQRTRLSGGRSGWNAVRHKGFGCLTQFYRRMRMYASLIFHRGVCQERKKKHLCST